MAVNSEQPYLVHIGAGAVRLLDGYLGQAERLAIICSDAQRELVETVCASVKPAITIIAVPDAEAGKTPAVLTQVWNALADAGFTRSDAILGLGGGAVTDLAGFAAATWLRGVRYLSVPTTLLAMVDASVGGKTGINLPWGKNLVGAFYEPAAVLADLDLLVSLPPREWRSGFAEILKAGFIADPRILELFRAEVELTLPTNVVEVRNGYEPFPTGETEINRGLLHSSPVTQELIRRAIQVKADVVSQDFRERTSTGTDIGREALNYGHSLAHAIEADADFTLRHGEAVALGMVFAAELAHRYGFIDQALLDAHREILAMAGLPTSFPDLAAWPRLRKTMSLDKKSRGDQLRLVVLHGLAQPQILINPAEALLEAAFQALGTTGAS